MCCAPRWVWSGRAKGSTGGELGQGAEWLLRFWLVQSETRREEEPPVLGATKPQFPPLVRGWSTAVPLALPGNVLSTVRNPQTSGPYRESACGGF